MKNKIPTALFIGPLQIGDVKLTCAVLDNAENTRVINASSVFRAFGRLSTGQNDRLQVNGFHMPPFLTAKNLEPFITKELLDVLTPIEYKIEYKNGNRLEKGYDSRILPKMCGLYLKARRAKVLIKSQEKLAEQAEILQTALSEIGVISLIDEATGFQYSRKYDALRFLLQKYIAEGIQAWSKKFPDKFFVELDRLYKNEKTTSRSRPLYYGKFINTYIYEPLENGYLKDELDRLNIDPKTKKRKVRFHQWLSEFGTEQLKAQITRVTTIAEISDNLDMFKRYIAKQNNESVFQFDFIEGKD